MIARCRLLDKVPSVPRILVRGSTDKNPNRTTDATRKPVAGSRKIGIIRVDDFVKVNNGLLKLAADASEQYVLKRRHFAQHQRRPGFRPPIGLRQGYQHNLSLHGIQG